MSNNLEQLAGMSVKKAVFKNVIPAMTAMLMTLIYNIADMFFIGQTGDALQVAAVSLATPMFLLFMSGGNIFGIGGAAYLSRSVGAGNKTLAKKISSFCFWCVLILGVVAGLAVLLFLDEIVILLGSSSDTVGFVKEYLSVYCACAPFVMISTCLTALIRSEGSANVSMGGMLIGNIVNIVLDPIFILVLDFGVQGAAIATAIGNICATVYYLNYILRKNTILSISIRNFNLEKDIFKNVLMIGIPASIATVLQSVASVVLNSQMATYGDLAVAGIGVSVKVTMITSMICLGIGMGVQPLLGFAIGAGDEKRYKDTFKFALSFAFILGTSLTIICFIFLNQIVGAFLSDADSFEYARSFSLILLTTSAFFGVLSVITNAIQSAGAATAALIVNLSRQGLIFIPLVFILDHIFGIYGIVAAQPVADVSSIILALILYVKVTKTLFEKDLA